jgi:hypothetical protein
MIMKNIFKAALILITLIFRQFLSQSNDKKSQCDRKEMLTAMGGMKNYNATFYSMGFCKTENCHG